jgi:predicted NUDIX family phosphoesterase
MLTKKDRIEKLESDVHEIHGSMQNLERLLKENLERSLKENSELSTKERRAMNGQCRRALPS